MTYSQFKTIRSVKQAFDLTLVEGDRLPVRSTYRILAELLWLRNVHFCPRAIASSDSKLNTLGDRPTNTTIIFYQQNFHGTVTLK